MCEVRGVFSLCASFSIYQNRLPSAILTHSRRVSWNLPAIRTARPCFYYPYLLTSINTVSLPVQITCEYVTQCRCLQGFFSEASRGTEAWLKIWTPQEMCRTLNSSHFYVGRMACTSQLGYSHLALLQVGGWASVSNSESYNHRNACVGRDLKDHLVPTLCQAAMPPTRPVCPCPTWSSTPPGRCSSPQALFLIKIPTA